MLTRSAILGLFLLGCSSEANEADLDPQAWQALPETNTAPELLGVWRSAATGHLIAFGPGGYEVFHEVGALCLADTGQLPALSLYQLEAGTKRLALHYFDYRDHPALLQNPLILDRIDALAPHCGPWSPSGEEDLLATFDALWSVFDRHYAFFDERGIDWDQTREVYRSQAQAATDPEALFEIFTDMLAPLNDGHVNLSGAGLSFNAGNPDLRQRLAAHWRVSGSDVSEGRFVGQWSREVRASIVELLDEGSHTTASEGALEWGRINGTVGYIRINRFARFDGQAPNRSAELDRLRQDLSAMAADLNDTQRLIVDVAHNGGGHDAAAMTVVEHFLDQPREVLIYAVPGVPRRAVSLTPSGEAEMREISLITSEITASAAEAFVLMMRALPHVTQVGEPTRGNISSLLPKPLPMDFRVTLAYQPVLDANGTLFEVGRIPPHRDMTLFPDDNLFGGYRDTIRQIAQD